MTPLDWEQEGRAPSKAELEREAYEEALIASYEERYHEFCRAHDLDPENTYSPLLFEEWFAENNGEDSY